MSDRFATPLRRTFTTEAAFAEFAAAFAAELRAGQTVALGGPLGAGKTAFVRAVVQALHGADQTSSPTFTFRHRYDGQPPIDHLDLYRVDDPGDLAELGLEDAFDGASIVLVEWWTKAPGLLPSARYDVEIEGAGDSPRTVTVSRRP